MQSISRIVAMTFSRWGIILRSRQMQLTLLGVSLAFGGLAYYQGLLALIRYDSLTSGLVHDSGYAVFALLLIGLVLSFSGLSRFVRQSGSGPWCNSFPTLRFISSVLEKRPYSRVFAASSIGYGLAFGVTSSTFVYQPGLAFSTDYGVNVPSVAEALCCGGFGQMPQLVMYLTQNLAILLIPINLILMFTASWLVGLNTALATYSFRNAPKVAGLRWIGGLGGFIGLFTACPTCASFFLLTTIGLTGAVSLAASLASFQGFFIGIGITVLIATPILASSRILRQRACALPKEMDESVAELQSR
ncbi:hypothetical protein E6H21_05965 [Candidatus Bathyarchaeota archaeon]|nr:MAG: hypothetical protein E6H21_05965 [Candidatus Bathyarchaeota archaeon]